MTQVFISRHQTPRMAHNIVPRHSRFTSQNMAFWIGSSPPSEILKEIKNDRWRDDGSSKIIHPGTGLSRGISDWLREQSDGSSDTTLGNFMILPHHFNEYAATHEQMDALARIWGIPPPIFGIMIRNGPRTLLPSVIVTSTNGTPWVLLSLKPYPDFKDLGCRFGTHMPKSPNVMITFPPKEVIQSTNMGCQPNCLVLCPRRYFEDIETAVSNPHLLQVGESRTPVWKSLVLIIAGIERGWRVFFDITLTDSEYIAGRLLAG